MNVLYCLTATAVLMLAYPIDAYAALQCNIHTKFACKPSGCAPISPGIVIGLDIDSQIYARCDQKGCSRYNVQITQSGLYYNISGAENGFLSKMMLDGSIFVEIVTASTNVLLSYGTCEPVG